MIKFISECIFKIKAFDTLLEELCKVKFLTAKVRLCVRILNEIDYVCEGING